MKLTNAGDQVDTSIGVRLETLHDQNTLKRDSPMTASYWIGKSLATAFLTPSRKRTM